MDKDGLYWICNLCGSKENVRGAEMTVGPNHICSVENNNFELFRIFIDALSSAL